MYVEKERRKSYLFLITLSMIVSPFSTIALTVTLGLEAIISIMYEVKTSREKLKTLFVKIKELFSIENVASIPIVFLILAYYMGNTKTSGISLVRNSFWFNVSSWENIILCTGIIFAECGLLIFILWKENKTNILYWISSVALLIIPFFTFSNSNELGLKVTSVWLCILMLLYIKSFANNMITFNYKKIIIKSIFLILCVINFGYESKDIIIPILKTGIFDIRKYTVETLADCKFGKSFKWIDNYVKRTPSEDLFFGKLSNMEIDRLEYVDIILDNLGYVDTIICQKNDLELLQEFILPTMMKNMEQKDGGLCRITLEENCLIEQLNIDSTVQCEGEIIENNILSSYKIKRFATSNPHFVHIKYKNKGNIVLPGEYTGKNIGIGYAFYDELGNLVGKENIKWLECILLEDEEINLSLSLTNAPKKFGNYKLLIWLNDDNVRQVLLEKNIMFE